MSTPSLSSQLDLRLPPTVPDHSSPALASSSSTASYSASTPSTAVAHEPSGATAMGEAKAKDKSSHPLFAAKARGLRTRIMRFTPSWFSVTMVRCSRLEYCCDGSSGHADFDRRIGTLTHEDLVAHRAQVSSTRSCLTSPSSRRTLPFGRLDLPFSSLTCSCLRHLR